MSSCSQQLPLWLQYIQALAVPLLAFIVAAASTAIAFQQMRIARVKVQHDTFDRRFAVYEATRSFLSNVFQPGNISEEEIRSYGLRTLDAQFLFDDELFRYLREVCQRVTVWRHANIAAAEAATTSDEKAEYQRIATENLSWIIQQGDDRAGFAEKFRPFLVLELAPHSQWWRWLFKK